MTAELKLRIAGGPGAASAARRVLSALERHLQTRLLEDVRLLVSELVTNSIRHGGVGPGESVALEVGVGTDKVSVAVTDLGPGFIGRSHSHDGDQPGGWGLYMVETVADRWGVETGDETRVWFEIDRRRPRFAPTG
jgi:anti-sigma regulatory factor (Ser/Thr protein kinase)